MRKRIIPVLILLLACLGLGTVGCGQSVESLQKGLDALAQSVQKPDALIPEADLKKIDIAGIEKSAQEGKIKLPENWTRVKVVYYVSRLVPLRPKIKKRDLEKSKPTTWTELDFEYDELMEPLIAMRSEAVPYVEPYLKSKNKYLQEVAILALLEWCQWHKDSKVYRVKDIDPFLQMIQASPTNKTRETAARLLVKGLYHRGVIKMGMDHEDFKKIDLEEFFAITKAQEDPEVLKACLDVVKALDRRFLNTPDNIKLIQSSWQPFLIQTALDHSNARVKTSALRVLAECWQGLSPLTKAELNGLLAFLNYPDKGVTDDRNPKRAVISFLRVLLRFKFKPDTNIMGRLIESLKGAYFTSQFEVFTYLDRTVEENKFGEHVGVSDTKREEIVKKWQAWWKENKDYAYWKWCQYQPDRYRDEYHYGCLIDEEAKKAGIPTEEYRKTHPWPEEENKDK